MKPDIEKALLDHLTYDPLSGVFIVKKQYGRLNIGNIAGYTKVDGYRTIGFWRRVFQEHHLAWFFVFGVWPSGTIYHINGNRADNSIANLRQVSSAENCKNRRKMKNNSSGVQGVYFHKRDGNWKASIRSSGKNIHLGYYDTKEAAIHARKRAEKRFGYHPNHGSSIG